MSGAVVFKVHQESFFREISEENEKKELVSKIAIFVSAALSAIGTIITCYYVSQITDPTWIHYGDVCALVITPAVLGGGGTIALVVWGSIITFSKKTYPSAEYPNKPSKISSAEFEKELHHLKNDDLEKIHDRYAKIGMAFLPGNAVISNPQAKELSRLIETFGSLKKERDVYLKDKTLEQAVKNAPSGTFPIWDGITNRIIQLETEWKTLQAGIQKDYSQQK